MNPTEPNTAITINADTRPMQKTWVVVKRKSNRNAQQRTNHTVEFQYGYILKRAEQLARSTSAIFERDYRKDNSTAIMMHCYMSNCFYFLLECDVHGNYMIEYAFDRCPFEFDIRPMLSGYPFDTRSKEVKLKPDFSTFYRNVLNFQDKKYIK